MLGHRRAVLGHRRAVLVVTVHGGARTALDINPAPTISVFLQVPVASTCRSPTLPLTLRLWGDGIRRIVTLAAIIIPGILSKFIQLRIHNNMYVISVVVYRNIPASCRVRLWASVAKRNGVADCGLETPRAAAGMAW